MFSAGLLLRTECCFQLLLLEMLTSFFPKRRNRAPHFGVVHDSSNWVLTTPPVALLSALLQVLTLDLHAFVLPTLYEEGLEAGPLVDVASCLNVVRSDQCVGQWVNAHAGNPVLLVQNELIDH